MRTVTRLFRKAAPVDPSKPHPFQPPPDAWALWVTGSTGPVSGVLHARVGQPRTGHPKRCAVPGCGRTGDDPIHEDA
jgi:hypothetical protein